MIRGKEGGLVRMAVGWVGEDAWTAVSVQIRAEFRESSDILDFLFFFPFLPFVRSVFSAPAGLV